MTKTRICLSIGIVLLAACVVTLFEFFYSPITGAVAVNALNGGVTEYGMARFVQTGAFTRMIHFVSVAALAAVWVPFIVRGK